MSPGQDSTGCKHLAPSSQKRHCTMIHLTTHSLDNLYKILKNTNNLKEIFLTDTFLFQMSGTKQFDHLLTESIWILNLSTAHIYQVEANTLLWPPL